MSLSSNRKACCPPLFTVSLPFHRFLCWFSSCLQLLLLSLVLRYNSTYNASVHTYSPSFHFSKLHCIPIGIAFPFFLNSGLPCIIFQGLEGLCIFSIILFLWNIFILCVYLKPSFFSSFLHLIAAGLCTPCLQCVVLLNYRWKTELQNCRNPRLPQKDFAAKYRCPVPEQDGNFPMLFMGFGEVLFPKGTYAARCCIEF